MYYLKTRKPILRNSLHQSSPAGSRNLVNSSLHKATKYSTVLDLLGYNLTSHLKGCDIVSQELKQLS